MKARIIKSGNVQGEALVSPEPIGFLGGVDPDTGIVVEKNHCLYGQSIANKILVFPTGKGSTVGSYTLYRLKKNNKAPLAMINQQSEAIVAVGAIISNIPMVDQIDITQFRTGDIISMQDDIITVISS
ncbi:MAG TPA: DUF126 domain-containing protein [Planctomycetota bacterium]|nr:DUF126 domain-containing protein [Planctomycetota bacterium]HRU51705.1 DUF126 domain-containing protein [Planctomycetota bacterium]